MTFVTPMIDGVRFFDKPPLMYWLAAGSMRLFGEHDWAARLPLALAVLALLLSIYGLGLRLLRGLSPAQQPDRGALYAALIFATSVGPYLYTRFFIPDLLICLWMTLGVHFFLQAVDSAACVSSAGKIDDPQSFSSRFDPSIQPSSVPASPGFSGMLPAILFAATLALNLLTKGLIGLVFPLGFVFLYLLLTRQFRLLPRLHLLPAAVVFLAIALPWHVLAALRNPAIAMPVGSGLPAHAGWAWFYLYNEHVARFLGKRIPHDYGQTPVWLFWLYALIWMMPWAAFLPAAIAWVRRALGHLHPVVKRDREAALTLTIWPLLVLVFFTFSARQEYYSLPALPALALLLAAALALAETNTGIMTSTNNLQSLLSVPGCQRWLLLPLSLLIATVCLFFAITAPHPQPGSDLSSLLSSNPELYNLSLGHLFDLTGAAMGLFRGPLFAVAAGMLTLGLGSYLLRRKRQDFAANLALAAGMTVVLMAAHEGLVRFNPILGSRPLADAIIQQQATAPETGDLILLDGELTSGSTLLFYTRQPVHLVNGRVNGPWFGSFWPDAPAIFENEQTLRQLWAGPNRIFLMTYNPAARTHDLASPAASVRTCWPQPGAKPCCPIARNLPRDSQFGCPDERNHPPASP